MRARICLVGVVMSLSAAAARAEFLFENLSFIIPGLDYQNSLTEYSEWDNFYAPHTAGNYPDIFAPNGGQLSDGLWYPVTRTTAGFPANDPIYFPDNPLAFWHADNPTITQTGSTSAGIISSLNIYTPSALTSYQIDDHTEDYAAAGTVVFQFQTDGTLADFATLRLEYFDGFSTQTIFAHEAEFLREYDVTGGGHWSAAGGYRNRVAVQWELSGLGITSYQILFDAQGSSMSFQGAALDTSDTFQAAIPFSRTWTAGDGVWSGGANWAEGTTTEQNGNVHFQNTGATTITLDGHRTVGEIFLDSPAGVTIESPGNFTLKANTGITTAPGETSTHVIAAACELGALNFFEINGGTVLMNGVVSGGYGLVKTGAGTLVLANNNTFTGFLGVQDGTVRLGGTNAYGGNTTVLNGTLIVAANAPASGPGALGHSSSDIAVGAESGLYGTNPAFLAELLIEGDRTIGRDVQLAIGNNGKRLGAIDTASGAIFSGTIKFTGASANPAASAIAAGNVALTVRHATDKLSFTGAMTGGAATHQVIIDGAGTVIFSGVNKTYANATQVAAGTLQIASGTALEGAGDVAVESGGQLIVHGALSGSGALAVNGGTIGGNGAIHRPFALDGGDVLSPGASVGSLATHGQTWANGGRFRLELSDAESLPGLGWDLTSITGVLDLAASSGGFTLDLRTLAGASAGLMENFDPAQNYSWIFASATAGLTNFSPSDFTIDAAAFQNALDGGSFNVAQSGNDLVLNFQSVPEPSSAVLLGSGALLLARRRRRGGAAVRGSDV